MVAFDALQNVGLDAYHKVRAIVDELVGLEDLVVIRPVRRLGSPGHLDDNDLGTFVPEVPDILQCGVLVEIVRLFIDANISDPDAAHLDYLGISAGGVSGQIPFQHVLIAEAAHPAVVQVCQGVHISFVVKVIGVVVCHRHRINASHRQDIAVVRLAPVGGIPVVAGIGLEGQVAHKARRRQIVPLKDRFDVLKKIVFSVVVVELGEQIAALAPLNDGIIDAQGHVAYKAQSDLCALRGRRQRGGRRGRRLKSLQLLLRLGQLFRPDLGRQVLDGFLGGAALGQSDQRQQQGQHNGRRTNCALELQGLLPLRLGLFLTLRSIVHSRYFLPI